MLPLTEVSCVCSRKRNKLLSFVCAPKTTVAGLTRPKRSNSWNQKRENYADTILFDHPFSGASLVQVNH